jgi:hypothetical protein
MRDYETSIGAAINRGISQLAAHTSVAEVLKIHQNPDNQFVEVMVAIQLGLPNQWMAIGHSPNGVRSIENATFSFPLDFPTHAPTINVRHDFDRSIAHVQPGSPDEPIFPCLLNGDLDELLHEQGLWAIVNQLVIWLEKAALGELIDPSQGWEPIRRDSLEDIIVADSDNLRNLISTGRKYELLEFRYIRFAKQRSADSSSKSRWYYGQIGARPLKPKELQEVFYEWETGSQAIGGFSLALIVFPERLPSGELPLVDRYLPETVTNIVSLEERAELYDCKKNLKAALSALESKLRGRDFDGLKLPVVLVLCVRRPFPLIGEDSEIELIPYVIEVSAPTTLPEGIQTPVFPACHQDALTQKLLQRFSGNSSLENRSTVLVGCGSLGSKIGIHLARSGSAPIGVVDKSLLSPHNAARHALLPNGEITWGIAKAKALATAIRGLGQKTVSHDKDITAIVNDSKLLKKCFPNHTWAVINATASLTVRETLAAIPPKQLQSRIIETTLFSNGDIGLLTVEGPDRNPNSADLITETYALMREDPKFSETIFEPETLMQSRSVGQGCSSRTMIISDAKISMVASAMALRITQMREKDLPSDTGQILLASITPDGMGLTWQFFNIPPVHIVSIDRAPSWTVRILDRAHQKIMQDYAQYPDVETGGILIGRMFESLQTFIVTDVLPAPVDSNRSKSEFILGTADAANILEQYSATCNHVLYCLGTWHSHLSDSGPSDRDWQTAQQVSKNQVQPLVLLIRTPSHYRAIAAISNAPISTHH